MTFILTYIMRRWFTSPSTLIKNEKEHQKLSWVPIGPFSGSGDRKLDKNHMASFWSGRAFEDTYIGISGVCGECVVETLYNIDGGADKAAKLGLSYAYYFNLPSDHSEVEERVMVVFTAEGKTYLAKVSLVKDRPWESVTTEVIPTFTPIWEKLTKKEVLKLLESK